MTKPKVSVIMCTYNRGEHFLPRAIESVLGQTFKDWELVISDDGSTDNTEQVVREYAAKDKRIVYYKADKNSGGYLGVPRNKVMRDLAQGDYIAFLDSDNTYRRDHLQVLTKAFEAAEKAKNGVIGFYGDRMLVDEYGKRPSVPGISGEWSVRRLLQQNYIDTSDVLIKREVLEKVGGWDESLRKFADWNLWARIGKAGFQMRRVPIMITDYYAHEGMNQLATNLTIKDLFDPMDCKIWPEKTIYGERPKLKVAVFSLVMDRLEYTKETFETMNELAEYPFDHFIVDNGSKEETYKYLREYCKETSVFDHKDRHLLRNEENVGISRGSNQALEAIGNGYDIIVKVDNDCRFLSKSWLKTIMDCYVIVRSYVLSPYVEGLIDSPGGVPRRRLDNPALSPYGYIGKNLVGFAPHLGGICIAAPREAYEGFRWREVDFFHGIQDAEFSQHCLNQGFALAYLENIKVEHIDTYLGQDEKYPEYAKKKKTLKSTKYAGKAK